MSSEEKDTSWTRKLGVCAQSRNGRLWSKGQGNERHALSTEPIGVVKLVRIAI